MVKAYQADGHPGTGVLWSEECVRTEEVEGEEEENGETTPPGTAPPGTASPETTEPVTETTTGTETPVSEHALVDTGMPGFTIMAVTLGVVLFTAGTALVRKGLGK
jgi:hypothetical protein